jgi:hypothetical protein
VKKTTIAFGSLASVQVISLSEKMKHGAREAPTYASGKANSKGYRSHVSSNVSVKYWKQDCSTLMSPVRAYLMVIETKPEAAEHALETKYYLPADQNFLCEICRE